MEKVNSILLIDDDLEVLSSLKDLVMSYNKNIDVVTVSDTDECLEIIDSGRFFEVIISDINMPKMNGYELTKEIIKRKVRSRIFLLSGYYTNTETLDPLVFGIEQVLHKPIKKQDFFDVLDKAKAQGSKAPKDVIKFREDDIESYQEFPIDVYVNVGSEKLLKVFNENDPVEKNRIKSYFDKDPNRLWIKHDDYMKLKSTLFLPIRVSTLVVDGKVDFDIFIDKDGIYERLIESGSMINKEHISMLKNFGHKKVYITDKSEKKYQDYIDRKLNNIIDAKNVSKEEKASLIIESTENALKNAFANTSEENMAKTKEMGQHLKKFISQHDSNIESLLKSDENSGIYQHSINVASLSFAIANEILKWLEDDEKKNLVRVFKDQIHEGDDNSDILFMAGLMHDMGKTKAGLSHKADMENTPDKAEEIKNHPIVAKEEFYKLPFIHEKVPEVIAQHEEFCDGSGYPNGVTKTRMSIFAQIISLVNYYDNCLSKKGLDIAGAIADVEANEPKFNKYLIPVLKHLVS